MSNLERDPAELVCEAHGAVDTVAADSGLDILAARQVPLGGPRAMLVHRTLPQRGRPAIGAWCFADHYGPGGTDAVAMIVPPHPHTGLQTASWLFAGEIEHRDSVGTLGRVRPGELNLMTAGAGIAHSEVGQGDVGVLHGVQLWIVLPDGARHGEPSFERRTALPASVGDADLLVFVGELAGVRAEASVFTPLVGAQLDLPPFGTADLPLEATFEHGLLIDGGPLSVNGSAVERTELAYLPVGATGVHLAAGENGARALLLGGEPFEERFIMWWNFIGRTHDEIVQFRTEWQTDVVTNDDPGGRFGRVDYPGSPLPAPEMPTVRLKPRD